MRSAGVYPVNTRVTRSNWIPGYPGDPGIGGTFGLEDMTKGAIYTLVDKGTLASGA